MIIGLTGSMGVGKGEVVNILEKFGFKHITLSSMVREEARKRGVEEEREKLMEVGNSMRAEHGAGVLAKMSLEKIKNSDNSKWVIDGIRNPSEIDELRKGENIYIIGLEASKEVLINRILKRNRSSDAKTEKEIVFKIERELGKGEKEDGQQVSKCMSKVDKIIKNEGTLENLNNEFMKYYKEIS